MFLRYFATTDPASPVSAVALHYLRSLVRIAPVRVIDPGRAMIGGAPDGPWARHHGLFHTPMDGAFINVVCTEPARWTWIQKVAAPWFDPMKGLYPEVAAQLVEKAETGKQEVEHLDGRLELWTAGVRNVLLIAQAPTDPAEYATALKYDALVTDSKNVLVAWPGGVGIYPLHVPVPVQDHAVMRMAVLGDP